MKHSTKYFDWITLAGAMVSIPVALYYYSFEYLMAATLLTLQTARVIAFQNYCCEIESDLEIAESIIDSGM